MPVNDTFTERIAFNEMLFGVDAGIILNNSKGVMELFVHTSNDMLTFLNLTFQQYSNKIRLITMF